MKNLHKEDLKLLEAKYKNISKIQKKLDENYPVQYLIGHVDFYGKKILVNKKVLIPRYETETLIEKTIRKTDKKPKNILDIGTGSGCISVVLKSIYKETQITAIDISKKALKVAKRNAKLNKTEINFIHKDIFKFNCVNTYDMIISNPPYIKQNEKIDPKTKYEPQEALYSDETALKFYKQILNIAKTNLNEKGILALEIEETIGEELKEISKKIFPKSKITVEKDLAGKTRYLFVTKNTK